MTRTGEKGVALVFTLFLMAALSAMAVSMMFLAQTETSASRNYKTMSQARYAGEAGVHRAIHYLSSTTYTDAVTSTAGFNTAVSPVTFGGNPVVLRPVAANSNHPDPTNTIKAAFAALFTGASLSVGSGATVTYSASATLLAMRTVNVYGGSTGIVQTWRIDAVGTVPGTLPATVEVGAILERNAAAAETYAIFATGTGCAAITIAGNTETDSYDSTAMTMSGGQPVTEDLGGSVGTNGNLDITGHVDVNGNLDTPRTGVGNCTTGNVTALTASNQATVNGDIIRLPQAKTYPAPTLPSPLPPLTSLDINSSTDCAAFGFSIFTTLATCSEPTSGNFIINANGSPLSFGNVAMSAGASLTINSGLGGAPVNLNVNSFSMAGNSSIVLGTGTSVVMNVVGAGVTGDVIDFTGGTFTNGSFDPSKFQILYAGDGDIKMTGGSGAAATLYAPNADVVMSGTADFYGSILSKTFKDTGGASVHYDRSLASKFFTLGNHVMSSFSWQKY
jgi:Tfp pilus assembly protein PilX